MSDLLDSDVVRQKQPLPNSVATLVLGIISIVSCWCYGVPGLICGIIALAISARPVKLYRESPQEYSGYDQMKAGRIMAIIGIILGGLWLLLMALGIAASFANGDLNF